MGRPSYGFVWASCCLTRFSRISQEFHQKFTGIHRNFTRISPEFCRNFARIPPEFRQNIEFHTSAFPQLVRSIIHRSIIVSPALPSRPAPRPRYLPCVVCAALVLIIIVLVSALALSTVLFIDKLYVAGRRLVRGAGLLQPEVREGLLLY